MIKDLDKGKLPWITWLGLKYNHKCPYMRKREIRWTHPGSSVGEESACSTGDLGSIPESEKSPGEENGNSFQYSCLENPMDRRAWWARVHGVTKSRR